MELSHTEKGDALEYRFFLYCIEHQIPCLKPLTNNLPYDCVIDYQEKLLKVQIKLGYKSSAKDTFIFNLRSTSKNYSECTTKNYQGKIDGFVTWYKEIPQYFFYVPIEKTGKSSMAIYYGENPKKNQNYYKDFIFNAGIV